MTLSKTVRFVSQSAFLLLAVISTQSYAADCSIVAKNGVYEVYRGTDFVRGFELTGRWHGVSPARAVQLRDQLVSEGKCTLSSTLPTCSITSERQVYRVHQGANHVIGFYRNPKAAAELRDDLIARKICVQPTQLENCTIDVDNGIAILNHGARLVGKAQAFDPSLVIQLRNELVQLNICNPVGYEDSLKKY